MSRTSSSAVRSRRANLVTGAVVGLLFGAIYAVLYHIGQHGATSALLVPEDSVVTLTCVLSTIAIFGAFRYFIVRFKRPNHGIMLTLFLAIALGALALSWSDWHSRIDGIGFVVLAVIAGYFCDKYFRVEITFAQPDDE